MEGAELIRELQQEHEDIRHSLVRIRKAGICGRAARNEFKQLRWLLERHLARVDNQVFPHVRARSNPEQQQLAFDDVRRSGGLLPLLFDSCEQAEEGEALMAYLRLLAAISRRQQLESHLLYPVLRRLDA